ncbi:MAG TPA: helix-turn-helix transcriptional regulator [Pseudonocardiaceae bacterium]
MADRPDEDVERDRVASLGDAIRRQRELAALPMRQLAAMVGISNPYLSQIERGLRAPSGQVLEAIAESLRTSAEVLVAAAGGSGADGKEDEHPVLAAIREDQRLTASQRQALTETYLAFIEVTAVRRHRRGRPTSKESKESREKPTMGRTQDP